ncbi:ribonuclease P protein component [Candidatus Desantisbacteria bacterium CG_4_10_14_0_8_um_filter_48_22]|uniref:Ribonuclease P protein component n=1 Tax=Candidatus Desantisbacteria bacterium CG_4_10_14_0_8_um_filter_48_22 TaxID=1974543 RepID=A0A2M7S673_9BACT|nr:MAG: ribonuclease P protein component [Candidatus Desantisbacteria bacterium CG1_02_49_89]PIV54178.1 MAG: ribonuclease P protein component [Candidatus Desantisbacteria bacterium CG02_land_8_20_14_3_00_49_13]PIZ14949.1 MAG: ribonuclease P protein component [Candidatus Desantisbacteria bacterium CG_4_10_14_0_8_um_filter_48_22]PJB27278.1 MAG: ribonuclease P protein component [Candidatus Desantisbacteria bacterium CG_4_9_14_3_um_filter_50_7]
MRQTFTRDERISREHDILHTLYKGTRLPTPLANYYFAANSKNLRRLCVIVSRRIGNACVRNRVKRCFREAFRLNKNNLAAGTDIIVKMNSAVSQKFSFKEAEQALLSACRSKGKLANK